MEPPQVGEIAVAFDLLPDPGGKLEAVLRPPAIAAILLGNAAWMLVICGAIDAAQALDPALHTLPLMGIGGAAAGLWHSAYGGSRSRSFGASLWARTFLGIFVGLPLATQIGQASLGGLGAPVGGAAALSVGFIGGWLLLRLAGPTLAGLPPLNLPVVGAGLLLVGPPLLSVAGWASLAAGGALLAALSARPTEPERAVGGADGLGFGALVGALLPASHDALGLSLQPAVDLPIALTGGALLGAGLASWRKRSAGAWGPSLLPALTLALAWQLAVAPELLLRTGAALYDTPDWSASALLRGLAGLSGLALGLLAGGPGRRSGVGLLVGLAAYEVGRLLLPPPVGAWAGALLAASLPGLGAIPGSPSVTRRLVGAVGVGAPAVLLILAPPSARWVGSSVTASLGDGDRFSKAIATTPDGAPILEHRAPGLAVEVPPGSVWRAGSTLSTHPDARGAERFAGYLPWLLGAQTHRALVLGDALGGAADALRRAGFEEVDIWQPDPALRHLVAARTEWNRSVGSDPAVRFLRVPRGSDRYDAVVVHLPSPWQPGAAQLWSGLALTELATSLEPDGAVVFRVPLPRLDPVLLRRFAGAVADRFDSTQVWLDPVGVDHLVLVGRNATGPWSLGHLLDAWTVGPVRADLQALGFEAPEDLLERLVTDAAALGQPGLLPPLGALAGPAAATLRADSIPRPLLAVARAASRQGPDLDLSGLDGERRQGIEDALRDAEAARSTYLDLLDAVASHTAGAAVGIARRMAARSDTSPRDLRTLIAPWLRRGQQLRARGDLEGARAELMMASAFSPQDVDVLLSLGAVLRGLGRLQDAEQAYQEARSLAPDRLEVIHGLADVRIRGGKLAEAADLLRDAIASHPGAVPLLVNLAWVIDSMAVGNPEVVAERRAEARRLYQQAMALDPTAPQPQVGLAGLLAETEDFKGALAIMDRVMATHPSCLYRARRGNLLHAVGRSQAGLAEVQRSLLDCPDQPEAMMHLGVIQAELGNYEQARATWERLLTLQPELELAKHNLAMLPKAR